jgi:[ribosomal protein S18]-alanine N-acetyltransferase
MPAGTPTPSTPVAPYHIDELTIEDGLDIAMWRTPGPWAVEDALQAPRKDEGYWAVRDDTGRLIGYCCFGEAARPVGLPSDPSKLDVALGLSPTLTGRHLSRDFAATVVDHAFKVAEDRRLRCSVASWNPLGRRTAEAVGFKAKGIHEIRGGSDTMSYFVYEI